MKLLFLKFDKLKYQKKSLALKKYEIDLKK